MIYLNILIENFELEHLNIKIKYFFSKDIFVIEIVENNIRYYLKEDGIIDLIKVYLVNYNCLEETSINISINNDKLIGNNLLITKIFYKNTVVSYEKVRFINRWGSISKKLKIGINLLKNIKHIEIIK